VTHARHRQHVACRSGRAHHRVIEPFAAPGSDDGCAPGRSQRTRTPIPKGDGIVDVHNDAPGINRRGFLTATAAAVGVTAAACGAAAAANSGPGTRNADLTEAVLAAFGTHRLVGLGEAVQHQLQEHHDVLQTLLADPRVPGLVNDIVVEFGNALYQDTIDAFVLHGKPVADADLRLVWRNTTQSPLETWDAPVYEQVFRRVRAVNWTLPPNKRIRVLLGDPPCDWSKITRHSQIPLDQRESHPASIVEQQVLAKGRRALICYGWPHLAPGPPGAPRGLRPGFASLIQQRTGVRTYKIVDLIPLQGDPGGLSLDPPGWWVGGVRG
jgi:hypothetical protein